MYLLLLDVFKSPHDHAFSVYIMLFLSCLSFPFHWIQFSCTFHKNHSQTTLKPLSNLFNKKRISLLIWDLVFSSFLIPLFSSLFHSLLTSYHFICFSSSIITTSHHVHLSLFIIHHLSSFNILYLQILHYPSYSFSFIITFSTFSLHFKSVCLVVLHDCYNKHLLFYHLK